MKGMFFSIGIILCSCICLRIRLK